MNKQIAFLGLGKWQINHRTWHGWTIPMLDDALFFAYQVINEVNVLEIWEGENTHEFSALFDSDDIFVFKQQNYLSINYLSITIFLDILCIILF